MMIFHMPLAAHDMDDIQVLALDDGRFEIRADHARLDRLRFVVEPENLRVNHRTFRGTVWEVIPWDEIQGIVVERYDAFHHPIIHIGRLKHRPLTLEPKWLTFRSVDYIVGLLNDELDARTRRVNTDDPGKPCKKCRSAVLAGETICGVCAKPTIFQFSLGMLWIMTVAMAVMLPGIIWAARHFIVDLAIYMPVSVLVLLYVFMFGREARKTLKRRRERLP